MPGISKLMIGFGVTLLACGAIGWAIEESTVGSGLGNGLAMIAAGAASAQGRRSLRKTGIFIGFALPILMTIIFAWRGYDQWENYRRSQTSIWGAAMLGMMALWAGMVVLLLFRLRASTQSAIAERGYSVTSPGHVTSPAPPGASGQRS